ncbi:hypothetical protein G3O08_18045 [Cryomorpha ignava]|uniref:Uncharacterized protein n=1 Tax=Cryomorpha ignava TaxID=101383 RepID=A0A7K3WX25_9FLAO|nr:hypothetical protein [Cryomorpha ignava]NEN25402.1 hypothetical protein [Cryomorpha ignava]
MNHRKIILNWIGLDAIATLLPLLFWSLLFEMLNVEIDLFDNRSVNLAEIYLLAIIVDKIIIIIWVSHHEVENKLKSRALAYCFGFTLFIIIVLCILYLTFNDVNWRT